MKRFWIACLTCILIISSATFEGYAVYTQNEKMIVLTFDDGPHPKQTLQILDLLDRYNIKATFFMIGVNVRNYPKVAQMVADRGHEIGNHTETHSHSIRLDDHELRTEIAQCQENILKNTGKQCKLFRPPEGALNDSMRTTINNMGYCNVLWTLDTRDWAHTPPEEIATMIIQNAKHGDIILMHDYIGANSPTLQALELFIPELLRQGFTFVTAGELLQYKK